MSRFIAMEVIRLWLLWISESDKKNKEENWVEELSFGKGDESVGRRERHIIQMRFFEGKTQVEVAQEIQISQAQVSRLEKNVCYNETIFNRKIKDRKKVELDIEIFETSYYDNRRLQERV